MHAAEVGEQLRDRITVCRKADRNTDCHGDQAEAEDRIDTADDRVDGNEGRDEVVDQDDGKPYGGGSERAADTLLGKKLDQQACGTYCENGTDHDQKNNCKYTHDGLHCRAKVDADDLGNGSAVVTLGKHTCEIVVNSTCENGTKGDPKENDRSPQRALHGTEDRAQAGDVQQLYQEQLPLRKHHEVDAVVDRHCRGLTVIRREGIINDLAVCEVSAQDDSKTENKANHNNLLFILSWKAFIKKI